MLAFCAGGAAAAPLHVERVVLLMRHGVRPPTHEPALSPAIAPDAWPVWEVPDGYLTPHGAAAIRQLAAYDRQVFAPGAGCPDVSIYTDVDERTEKTGEAFAEGFAPGCKVAVQHAGTARDPLFSPLDGTVVDAKAVKKMMLAAAGGSLAATVAAHAALFNEMQAVLAPGQTAFLDEPAKISAKQAGAVPKVSGPVAEGASAAEDFLLEYLDGKPMAQVAWGRATPAQIAQLLALHPLDYTITERPAVIADVAGKPLADKILADLTGGPKVSVLVGHDDNQAALGGLLGLHWQTGGYPADDPPPGGGIMFTLLADDAGQQYVTADYQVQTMAQIRGLQGGAPAVEGLAIPGCGDSTVATACTLGAFTALIGSK